MAVTMASPPPLSPVTIANTPLQPHGSDGCITPPSPSPQLSHLSKDLQPHGSDGCIIPPPPPLPPVISPLQGPPASWR